MTRQQPPGFSRRSLDARQRWLAALGLAIVMLAVVTGVRAFFVFGSEGPVPATKATAAGLDLADPAPSGPRTATSPSRSGPASTPPSVRSSSAAATAAPRTGSPALAPKIVDLRGWSSRQLAATLVMTGATMGDADAIQHASKRGVGGVVLFGPSSPGLEATLRRARAAAPRGNAPLFSSDEEGGQVQRLSSLIYPLPSAEVMGHWDPAKVTRTATDYAVRMRALGVTVALGPVADLAVPGHYMASAHRSFSSDPGQVGISVNAWNDGLAAGGVLSVTKHWPGHGQASNTHVGSASVPPWSVLTRRDLLPFKAVFAHGSGAVMVGHLRVPGLTEGAWPASESPAALRALRAQAGDKALILTDDLSMAAASSSVGISPARAAVRSLVSGADIAMVCWAPVDQVIDAVTNAIDEGKLPRHQAEASARRVLMAKMSLATSR